MVYLKIMAERNGGDFELLWMFEFLIFSFSGFPNSSHIPQGWIGSQIL